MRELGLAAGRRALSAWGAAACLAAGSLLAAPAAPAADEAPAAAAAAATDIGQLQEVIVYARRRPERIEDAPLAISVRSGEALRAANAVLLDDVGRDVPNLRMYASPQSVAALDVSMRGQTVNRSAIVFDPAVGLYVDGVYVANGQGALMTLLDIDSVSVLRGTQGTLFGRNNTGGSILLTSHRPDLDRESVELATSGGDYSAFMGRAILNVPVTGDFALRFAIQTNQHDGFGSSVSSGQDNLQNQNRYQARVGALWKSGATDVYFTYERFEAHEGGAILHPLTGPPPGTLVSQIGALFAQFPIPGLPVVSFPSDPYQTDGNFPSSDVASSDTLQLTTTHLFEGGLALKLILGYRHLDATTALDVDASTIPFADSTLFNTSNQKSAELQLNDKSLGGRLDWVAGLYWFRDDGSAPSVQAPASPDFLAALQALYLASGGLINFVNPPVFSALPVYEHNSATNSSAAAYVHGEYQLTSDWAVAAGLRRTDDKRQLEEASYVDIPGFGPNCTILDTSLPPPYQITGPCPPIDKSVSYGFWSWELSTRYRLSPELNVYARAGRSQRSGGWNAPLATVQDEPFRPEQLTDFELGLKANLLGGALGIDADVFYGNYDDMQRLLARLNLDNTPVTQVINAGRAHIGGAELETLWQVTPHAALQGSFGWIDARYQTFLYTPVAGAPPLDLSGNDFYQTPRYMGTIAGMYRIPTAAGDLTLRADYAWQDRIEFNVINDFNYQRAYGTANARIAFASPARTWELALFADNLTDQRYAYTGGTLGTPGAPSPSIAWQIPGAPRTYGVEGTYRWAAAPR